MKLTDLRQLDLLRTVRFRARAHSPNVFVYRNLDCYISPGAQLNVTGSLKLGCQWENGRYYPSQLVVKSNACLNVLGDFAIYTDCDIWVNEGATLTLGSGFINNGSKLACYQNIEIGEDVALSGNVTIRDSDSHMICDKCANTTPIRIGNHVWVGMNVTILKGVIIGDGAVIAAGSVVTRDVPCNTLVAGVPAEVKKTDVNWK